MGDRLDLVAEERHAIGSLEVRRQDLHDVAARAEATAAEHDVVAGVLDVDQRAQERLAPELLAHDQVHELRLVLGGRPETVDAGHRRDEDHVPARQQARRGRVAQAVDVVVDRRVLLDVVSEDGMYASGW